MAARVVNLAAGAVKGPNFKWGMLKMLKYLKIGSGDHVVIGLHGWFGDETTFSQLSDSLALEEFTWICPAYRGYGINRNLTGEYSVNEVANDILELADELGLEKFSLVGHSMGGKVIQKILSKAPERIRKLVGVTPVPAIALPLDDETRNAFTQSVNVPEIAQGIVSFSVGGRLPEKWINRTADHGRVASPTAYSGYFQSWSEDSFYEDIQGNSIPFLVIGGEHDGGVPVDLLKATFLKHYPNARLEIMTNSGHYPMDETPLALVSMLENFLR